MSHTDSKRFLARRRIHEPQSFPHVVRQKDQEHERNVQKVTVNVLQDERK